MQLLLVSFQTEFIVFLPGVKKTLVFPVTRPYLEKPCDPSVFIQISGIFFNLKIKNTENRSDNVADDELHRQLRQINDASVFLTLFTPVSQEIPTFVFKIMCQNTKARMNFF